MLVLLPCSYYVCFLGPLESFCYAGQFGLTLADAGLRHQDSGFRAYSMGLTWEFRVKCNGEAFRDQGLGSTLS